jgi:hypothetical protein
MDGRGNRLSGYTFSLSVPARGIIRTVQEKLLFVNFHLARIAAHSPLLSSVLYVAPGNSRIVAIMKVRFNHEADDAQPGRADGRRRRVCSEASNQKKWSG